MSVENRSTNDWKDIWQSENMFQVMKSFLCLRIVIMSESNPCTFKSVEKMQTQI